MTQYFVDADNGDDTHSGLNITQTASVVITSSDPDDSVLTAAVHGLTTGNFVNITGHSGSTPNINGANQQITVVDTTNFTIDGVDITTGGTGGTVQEEDGPFADIDQFTENSRSAGDICSVRRGNTADIGDGTDVTFTSDGTKDNPIILEADFDDHWSDDVTSSQTYTLVFGSKTHTASATITVLIAGEWIYNTTDGDDPREFAYEVASVSGTTLTLKLPFKGSTGAAKSLTVMKANPFWGLISAAFQLILNSDSYWLLRGLDVRSDDFGGTLSLLSNNVYCEVHDLIIQVPASVAQVCMNVGNTHYQMFKCRFDGGDDGISGANQKCRLFDCLFENSLTNDLNFGVSTSAELFECEFTGTVVLDTSGQTTNSSINYRNCQFGTFGSTETIQPLNKSGSQDHDGTVGNSEFYHGMNQALGTPVLFSQEETTTVRSGGSNTSIKIAPGAASKQSTIWELGKIKLLEIPLYATTSSKKYEIFFRPTLTSDWTTDPTAAELWIELEYWGHASNNFRRITKSTGVIDMNGSTTYTALDVTVAPSQSGVAFLRAYYAKPIEDTDSFFIDPVPVIT